jgi:NADH-quinone oxidoreductase subunit L
MGSGSVIHGMEHGVLHTGEKIDPQDMMNMGGLRKKMPVTFWTFLIGGFALSGFPLVTAGFWSKDEILSSAYNNGHTIVFITLAVAALLTAFYTMRQITLTFLGNPRSKSAENAHETPVTMTLPLVVLSVFAVSAGWVGIPREFPVLGGLISPWFKDFVGSMMHTGEHVAEGGGHSPIPLITSLVVALGGLLIGWLVYRRMQKGAKDPVERTMPLVHKALKNKYWWDEIYHFLFVRPAYWISETFSYKIIDKGIIDGILHGIGAIALWLGAFFRNVIDLPVVNHLFEWVTGRVPVFGGELRKVQTGRVQQYMVIAIVVVVVVGALFIYFQPGIIQ